MPETPTGRQILDTPMPRNDAGAITIRGYLVALLAALWDEREEFSGKQPFGKSGWHWYLYEPLIRAGHLPGVFDEAGVVEVDTTHGRELIASAIQALAGENR